MDRDRAAYMVAELAKCQAAPAGFNAGYLSGFPESDFDTVETGVRRGVPHYCPHKTLAGLLDVWRHLGNTQARDVLLRLAGWVDCMNTVLADLYQQTGDSRWLTAARRFDHAAVIDPLAANEDRLDALHANTQIPKMVGSAREYKATGTQRYLDIARNFWQIVVDHHSYVFGGNSVGEFFRSPDLIARFLTDNTCESCNTHNMIKLTRELFLLDPDRVAYVDHYERAMTNQLIGQQNPDDAHGHVCYFTPTNPGGRRTYSNDYNSFTCCQGTGLETQTKLADSIYLHSGGDTLHVNLFVGSTLTWAARGVTVTQTTTFPASDTTTPRVTGASGQWTMRVRVPGWTSGATVSVNGVAQGATTPGTYASISRVWTSGDTVTVRLPMRVSTNATPDDPAVTYGPVVLSGAHGNTNLGGALPVLDTGSVQPTGTPLRFTATANGAVLKLRNGNSGKLLCVLNGVTAPGAQVVQDADNGGADNRWRFVPVGGRRVRNVNSGLVLGVTDMSTANGGLVIMWGDTGTADHLWSAVLAGGDLVLANQHSGEVLAVENAATANGARIVQWDDTGAADRRWRLRYDSQGRFRIQNAGSGRVLGVRDASMAEGAQVVQWDDNGTRDHLWQFV